jgi:circadian clock protein KaiC
VSVLPVTSLGLHHDVSTDRLSSGLPALDGMLGGKGFYRGSTILVSGTAGAGKTTLAAHFVDGACSRGERCLYFLFEESPAQILRNMRSAGIDLQPWIDRGLLQLHADRPSRFGLETHLLQVHRAADRFNPSIVVIDPMTNLLAVGTAVDVRAMLTRLIDFLKVRGVTAMFTSLSPDDSLERTESMMSSLMDAWVLLVAETEQRKRRRSICVLKSRGMPHSDEVRDFQFSDHGIDIQSAAPRDVEGN